MGLRMGIALFPCFLERWSTRPSLNPSNAAYAADHKLNLIYLYFTGSVGGLIPRMLSIPV